ncbi:MAG: MBL fold metallo-hydrolase [Rhodospirillales bacterium]|nr:MAG: MBL fold metallo-hydrolase [Rhodospirillales bacterium]
MSATSQTPFTATVVDRLSVRVVVDSRYERFLPDAEHPHVAIEHVRRIPGRQMTTLAGEWGLALHLESEADGARSAYLLDFGYTPEILNRNLDLLDIDPARLSGLILSHGHRDHYGGLEGFVAAHRARMPGEIPLFVGAEEAFSVRWVPEGPPREPGGTPEMVCWGAPNRTALTAQQVMPVCCEAPRVLDGPFTSGYIARDSFEEITGNSKLESFEHFSEAERRGELIFDTHPEEHATCYLVRGKGLVVISSCGHAGIVNSVKTAMAVAGTDRLHAVIGGFHLAASKPDYIEHTVDELEALAPDLVLPMHCTGTGFIESMRRRMPERLITSNLGSRFTLGV